MRNRVRATLRFPGQYRENVGFRDQPEKPSLHQTKSCQRHITIRFVQSVLAEVSKRESEIVLRRNILQLRMSPNDIGIVNSFPIAPRMYNIDSNDGFDPNTERPI